MSIYFSFFFFFKQKTAYEMRISDWSSDVCSSDLIGKEPTLSAGNLRDPLRAPVPWSGEPPDPFAHPQLYDGVLWRRVGAYVVDLAIQIGRASCRERVCQSV